MGMPKHLEVILRKMCEIAGVDFNTVDFKQSGWYLQHSWTIDKEANFKAWLFIYLKNTAPARHQLLEHRSKDDRYLTRAINEFIFQYGWKTEEFKGEQSTKKDGSINSGRGKGN